MAKQKNIEAASCRFNVDRYSCDAKTLLAFDLTNDREQLSGTIHSLW